MEFCPKCGAVLIKKTKKLGCPRCSYISKGKVTKLKTSEKGPEIKKITVLKQNIQTEPIVQDKCTKCGNEEAYFWTVQTRASDEAETKFFKCTKCSHTHRNYD
ncbi:transcription factor S [archaeon]|jgi:transcription factor S|nr:transcription factor S [archaeon]MBT4373660.1 transcription factor S [archaeon]MBT4531714.1 transcription factor S [archaeon]MBT7001826.1 transcription factor S [archaeon]MBT7281811.1 transcription factor S [archaeon]